MSKRGKKILTYSLLGLDAALTIFLFVVSIIMIVRSVTMTPAQIQVATGFIAYLQNHTTFYLCLFVIPLFLLLAANIVALVMYLKKDQHKQVKMSDLTEEQKEALKKQLLEDLTKK